MTACVARSISRSANERLHRWHQDRFDARVLAVFERACDLATPDGAVVALVLPQVGDGPLNVVVDGEAGLFSGIDPGAPVTLDGDRLWTGDLKIDLARASAWEPRPDWDTLRAGPAATGSCLPLVRARCLRYAPGGSLMGLLGAVLPHDAPARAVFSTASKAAEMLRAGWAGDLKQLREGAARLAGLGSGLTPAGDDFLIGAMLQAWLAHPAPDHVCCAVGKVAVSRTTTLSAAFLQAAARGECSAPWHALLAEMSAGPGEGTEAGITAAVRQVLKHGATSGADSLAGFLCFQGA
jgi:hypothetical protein